MCVDHPVWVQLLDQISSWIDHVRLAPKVSSFLSIFRILRILRFLVWLAKRCRFSVFQHSSDHPVKSLKSLPAILNYHYWSSHTASHSETRVRGLRLQMICSVQFGNVYNLTMEQQLSSSRFCAILNHVLFSSASQLPLAHIRSSSEPYRVCYARCTQSTATRLVSAAGSGRTLAIALDSTKILADRNQQIEGFTVHPRRVICLFGFGLYPLCDS